MAAVARSAVTLEMTGSSSSASDPLVPLVLSIDDVRLGGDDDAPPKGSHDLLFCDGTSNGPVSGRSCRIMMVAGAVHARRHTGRTQSTNRISWV